MIKEASNTFTDGLIQDLNPINTPNTILTDNLNGTIITYDGNEYSLQNDRGNYPLQYCKLKPNYIPVGVKEYADTLYIVSYNPIDGKTEIGSYPSPLDISGLEGQNDHVNIPSLVQQSKDIPEYTKLVQKAKIHIFSDDNLKIYPGDEYKIELEDKSEYVYEELEYYIIDENRNKHDITQQVKENENFCPVGWTIPGWLAVQHRLAVFDGFQVNIRSFEIPTLAIDAHGKLNLNFQLKITDDLLLNRLQDTVSHLNEFGLHIRIQKQSLTRSQPSLLLSEEFLFDTLDGKVIEWYETSKILWAQKTFDLYNISQGDLLTIIVTPFIQVSVKDQLYKIVYDNFTESLNLSLAQIGTYQDFSIAKDVWKFWIEEDDNEHLYLEFDVNGPSITNNSINLYYKIDDLTSDVLTKTYYKIDSYTGIGQNVVTIDFNDTFFTPEGIYSIELVLCEQNPSEITLTKDNSYSIKKLIIASHIFSDFVPDVNNFENITFDDWTSKYNKTIKNTDSCNLTVVSDYIERESYVKGDIVRNEIVGINLPNELKTFYTTINKPHAYDHTAFLTKDQWNSIEKENTKFIRGYKTDAKLTLQTDLEITNGKLWDGTYRSLDVNVLSHDEIISTNNYLLKSIRKNFDLTIQPIIGSEVNVTYVKESNGWVRGSTSRKNTYTQVGRKDGVPYGIMVGYNEEPGLNDQMIIFAKYNINALQANGSGFPTKVEKIDSGQKDYLANPASRSITNFMTENDYKFIVMFIITERNQNVGGKAPALFRKDDRMFYSVGENVQVQPFIVFINSQGYPIFFEISGVSCMLFENAKSGDFANHDFPIDEWQGLSEFVNRINSVLTTYIKYEIFDVTDGCFINCKYDYNDENSVLNVKTTLKIPEITNWKIGTYNLLNPADRLSLQNHLTTDLSISCGNLLTGTTTKLDAIDIKTIQFNETIESSSKTKTSVNDLIYKLDLLRKNAKDQWYNWEKDDVFKNATQSFLTGVVNAGSGDYVTKFKNSAFASLLNFDNSSGSLIINEPGERLMFKVLKEDGTDVADDSSYHIGVIHPTISFP